MYSETTKVINKSGIHARPASELALKGKKYASIITIKNLSSADPRPINVRSIMKVLAASISGGSSVEISAEGEDEQQAVKGIVSLFESGFLEK